MKKFICRLNFEGGGVSGHCGQIIEREAGELLPPKRSEKGYYTYEL